MIAFADIPHLGTVLYLKNSHEEDLVVAGILDRTHEIFFPKDCSMREQAPKDFLDMAVLYSISSRQYSHS